MLSTAYPPLIHPMLLGGNRRAHNCNRGARVLGKYAEGGTKHEILGEYAEGGTKIKKNDENYECIEKA